MNNKKITLGIVVPCYNEEAVIEGSISVLCAVIDDLILKNKISENSFIGFIDDGSRDSTWEKIVASKTKFKNIKAIKLAGNKGHQNALIAGLYTFNESVDALVSIDADLQDDVKVIEIMLDKHLAGNDIVYGVRSKRESDTFFKKYSALLFYKLMLFLGVDIVYNHADYRLASKKVIDSLKEYQEINLFLRGIFPSMGYLSTTVEYDRKERKAGVSKYPLIKMISFAWEGITSFSIKPLRFVTMIGFIIFIISLLLSIYIVYSKVYLQVVPGWASTVLPIYLLGGIQLLSTGMIGEYLGKIYQETKRRPRYLVDKIL